MENSSWGHNVCYVSMTIQHSHCYICGILNNEVEGFIGQSENRVALLALFTLPSGLNIRPDGSIVDSTWGIPQEALF